MGSSGGFQHQVNTYHTLAKGLILETTLSKNLSFGQNQGIAWSSDSNLWGNQLLKENLSTRLGLTTHSASRMIPLGMGKLEFRDVIPNKLYAQPFIHVKITSSKTMRFATIVNIGKGNEHVI